MKNSNDEWISISDLMSGLMMVFLFISIALLIPERNYNKQIKEALKKTSEDLNDLNQKLDEEFETDFKRWGAERLRDGTIRFRAPEIIFSLGSSQIRPSFQKILKNFCPRYVKIFTNHFNSKIQEVRINGHASSEWDSSRRLDKRSFNNTQLSVDRAINVHKFCFYTLKDKSRVWFSEKAVSVGSGFVHKIKDKKGQENKTLSRRVEFRVQPKSFSDLEELLRIVGSDNAQ